MANAVNIVSTGTAMRSYSQNRADNNSDNKQTVSSNGNRDSFTFSGASGNSGSVSNNSAAAKAIYRRMTSGSSVSAADERKLKELDPKMYSAAKAARRKAQQSAKSEHTLDARA